MHTRRAPTTTTDPGDITGGNYAGRVAGETDSLANQVINPTQSVGGTADAITWVTVPPLVADPVHGQTFRILPTADNTGAVTGAPDGRGPWPIRDQLDVALGPGAIKNGRAFKCWFDTTVAHFRIEGPTEKSITDQIPALVAAQSTWAILGDTTVSSAVAQVEHAFTANAYLNIMGRFIGAVPSVNTRALDVSLRHAGGALLTLSTPASLDTGDGNGANGMIEALLDPFSTNKHYLLTMRTVMKGAAVNLNPYTAPAIGDQALRSATSVDRIRYAMSAAASISAGRFITYGLRVPT